VTPEYSVVVPIASATTTLDELLSRLEDQTVAEDAVEVLVVTEALPSEAVSDRIRRHPSRVKPVVVRGCLGVADALEHGRSAARGRIVVFLGETMRPERDWLAEYRRAFEASSRDVLCGGHRGPAPPGRGPGDERLELGLRELCEARPQSIGCAFAFRTANVAVRRDALDRTSGFNPCLGDLGDVELGIRLWEVGATFGFADRAAVVGGSATSAADPLTRVDDISALFWRHPYGFVLLLAAWLGDITRGVDSPLSRLALTELATDHALLDPLGELKRVFDRRLPVSWASRGWLIDYLAKRFPALHTPSEAASYVDLAIERGLLQRRDGGDVELDGRLLENWIHDCLPPFQRSQLRLGLGHDKRTPFLRLGAPHELTTLHGRGRYEVTIEADALGDRTARVHIPLPVARAHQRELAITSWEPAWLSNHLDAASGMLVDVPFRAGATQRVSCAYEFRCLIDEVPPLAARPHGDRTEPDDSMVRPAILRSARARAERLVHQLGIDGSTDPLEAVRAIYGWIQSTIVLGMVPPLARYHHNMLETGTGDCFGQMFLFVNLCRLAGVPAQLRFGAYFNEMFDPSLDRNVVELFGAGASPMSHVWAEFYLRDRGWFPLEIQGGGKRRINAGNVGDATLRSAIRDAITSYEQDLLGYMSPSRIYASDRLLDRVTHPTFTGEADQAAVARLQQATGHWLKLTLDR
jgi:transglutaminase-like putative cysteine protease